MATSGRARDERRSRFGGGAHRQRLEVRITERLREVHADRQAVVDDHDGLGHQRDPFRVVHRQGGQRRTDLAERKHLLGSTKQDRLARHPVDDRGRFVLCDRCAAGPPNLEQTGGAVAPHAGEEARRSPTPRSHGPPTRKSTSTDGRHEWRSSSVVKDVRPLRTTRCRSGGAIITEPARRSQQLAIARVGDAMPGLAVSHSANADPNGSPMCITNKMGTGNGAGQRAQEISTMAAGPPVDAPIAMTVLRLVVVGTERRQRCRRSAQRTEPCAQVGDHAECARSA